MAPEIHIHNIITTIFMLQYKRRNNLMLHTTTTFTNTKFSTLWYTFSTPWATFLHLMFKSLKFDHILTLNYIIKHFTLLYILFIIEFLFWNRFTVLNYYLSIVFLCSFRNGPPSIFSPSWWGFSNRFRGWSLNL